MIRVLLLLLVSSTVLLGQSMPARPSFERYPVERIFKGVPAQPKLDKDQRMFRTVIRNGSRSRVQFAGHYTVPQCGCGTGCSLYYIVDSITGRVYDGEFAVSDLPGTWLEKQSGDPPLRIQFIASSRLLKINGCPNEHDCGYYDYVMVEGKGLKLISKWLLPREFQ
jgi:hypothetical protein